MKKLLLIILLSLTSSFTFGQTCSGNPCTLTTAGTYSFTVPGGITSLTAVSVKGASGGGGGGASYNYDTYGSPGTNGGASEISVSGTALIEAKGGCAGGGGDGDAGNPGTAGASGGCTGSTVTPTGGTATTGGGTSPAGTGGPAEDGNDAGGIGALGNSVTASSLTVTPGAVLSITVGAAGTGGWNGGNGTAGSVSFSWASSLALPTVAPAGGQYATAQTVTVTETTSGATVATCFDAMPLRGVLAINPCTPSTNYTAPVSVTQTGYLRVQATLGLSGPVVSTLYTIGTAPTFTTQPSVSWVSPSSIAASFVTNVPSSVEGYCSLTSGTELTATVGYARSGGGGPLYTSGFQATNFVGTSTHWGTWQGGAVAITGLHQNTTYYCVYQAWAASGAGPATSAEFTATTSTLSTIAPIVNATSKVTRLNDQYNGQNGMPNNGFYFNGDTEMSTFADDGNYYGTCHDCGGVLDAYSNTMGWVKWNASHTIATQVDGVLATSGTGCSWGAGVASTCYNWIDGGTWESWGIQSVRGQIYFPIQRCVGSYCLDYNIMRSPDHLAHSISAGNQWAQGLGPSSTLTAGADIPVAPGVAPNNPIAGTINSASQAVNAFNPLFGPIQSCQDESINCIAQANNDGYVYGWGQSGGASITQDVGVLTRTRVEDMPLLDPSKSQVYICNQTGDDGLYDSCWSNNPLASLGLWNTGGALPNSQFLPDFNRWVFLSTLDNTNGGSVVLYDCGPYPWGAQTAIGSVSWDNDLWPNYYASFGQILPGSYLKTSTTPLSALLMLTTTGTIAGFDSTNGPPTDNPYSPYIAKLNLVSKSSVPTVQKTSVANVPSAFSSNGLDVYYDFRATSSLIATPLPNLSPNDPTQAYAISASNFKGSIGAGGFLSGVGYFSPKGMFSFYYPPISSYGIGQQYILSNYSKAFTACTIVLAFEHTGVGVLKTAASGETPFSWLASGGSNSSIRLYRNGQTANSWYLQFGSATLGPFTIATDGAYAGLVIRWNGSTVNVFSSPKIPASGYTLPLTPLASASVSSISPGNLVIGGYSAGTGVATNPSFQGTMSNFLVYSRALSDAELIRSMGVLRKDMLSRGIILP